MPIDKIKKLLFAGIIVTSLTTLAGPLDDAKSLYNNGLYEDAVEALTRIVKSSPRDGSANFYLGASLYELGKYSDAIAPLKVAAGRNVIDAYRLLALCELKEYNADEAASYMESWDAALKKARKSQSEDSEIISAQILNMKNMLDRVERIEIVDSISVDSALFFQAFHLSESAGRILPSDAVRRLGAGDREAEVSLAFAPEANNEIIWAQTDSAGVFNLFGASILDDGTIEGSKPLGDNLGEGGSAQFPFMMPDGVTLYFANNGVNSIGGYDIFMTRRTDDGSFYQPQNIGMPYNSTGNDYMLAIDEESGLGWWASDRYAEPGKVVVYVFMPSSVRVNIEPDDVNLIALAKLADISLTRKPDVDYNSLLQSRLPKESQTNTENIQKFNLDLGNGKVYTRLSDFKNNSAKSAMLEVLACEAEIRNLNNRVDKLRLEYHNGNKTLASVINESEGTLDRLRKQLVSLRNKVIRLEK